MSASKQQAVPSQEPPPGPPSRAGQSDMFVTMIEGPAVSIGVRSNDRFQIFVIPYRLLAQHSLRIRKSVSPPQSSYGSTNKRKASQISSEEGPTESATNTEGDDVVVKVEPDIDEDEAKEEKSKVPNHDIHLDDFEPPAFGLFLHYIYQGSYPCNVDRLPLPGPSQQHPCPPTALNPVTQAQHRHSSFDSPVHANPNKRPRVLPETSSAMNISGTPTTTHHGSEASPSTTNSKATDNATLPIVSEQPPPTKPTSDLPLAPNPTPPSPSSVPSNRQSANPRLGRSFIPSSIAAYFLGHNLGACAFINYAIARIYSAIGTCFPLTPCLVAFVWYIQDPLPQARLRRLILDYMITYWSHPDPNVRAAYISSYQRGWEGVFDEYPGLRNEFLHGLQHGFKVNVPEAYFITNEMLMNSRWLRHLRSQDGVGASASVGPGPNPGEQMEGVIQSK